MTEEITGIDLVQAQIRIAGGATLSSIGIGSQVGNTSIVCSIYCYCRAFAFFAGWTMSSAWQCPMLLRSNHLDIGVYTM